MGVFDCVCVESGLVIDDRQRLLPIIANRSRQDEDAGINFRMMTWEPLALPIAGRYDSYGSMDIPDELDANMLAIQAFGAHVALPDGDTADGYSLGELLEDIRADGIGGTWNDRPVSFALVEDGIYRAIVDAVAADGITAWRRFAQFGADHADDPTMRRLVDALLADPADGAIRKVYVDHLLALEHPQGKLLALLPSLEDQSVDTLAALLPHAATVYRDTKLADLHTTFVDFLRFRAWGTRLSATFGAMQFSGYESEPEILPAARARYAGMPELLAAVTANDERWRERRS